MAEPKENQIDTDQAAIAETKKKIKKDRLQKLYPTLGDDILKSVGLGGVMKSLKGE